VSIPKSIHLIWTGPPLPGWAQANMFAWRDLHPKWRVRLWREGDLKDLMNQDLYDRAEAIVPPDAVGQFRADVARYEILYRFGGLYVDVDTRPLRPIDDALSGHPEFAVSETPEFIGNTYLASEPESQIMLALVKGLPGSVKTWPVGGTKATIVSGPQYMTPIWRKLGGWVDERTELFFPYSYKDVKKGKEAAVRVDPNAYAIHDFNHVRELKRGPRE
jgi:mannosyltransferase OCH1-like enzyme